MPARPPQPDISPAEKQSPRAAQRRMGARFPPARAGCYFFAFAALAAFAVSARIFSTRST